MDDVVEPAAEDFQLPRVLAALAEPNRLATVRYVARSGESCCSEVMQEAGLAMTKSTFSHHLRILREAGVLTKRIQGTKGYTTLRKADLDDRFPGLIDAIIDAENQDLPLERTRGSASSVPHSLSRPARTFSPHPHRWPDRVAREITKNSRSDFCYPPVVTGSPCTGADAQREEHRWLSAAGTAGGGAVGSARER